MVGRMEEKEKDREGTWVRKGKKIGNKRLT